VKKQIISILILSLLILLAARSVFAQSTPAPVAPVAPAAPAAPAPQAEDKRVRGVTLSPSVTIFPIGFDSINITGNEEGKRYFFALKPMLVMNSAFKTSTDKTLNFTLDYEMTWREYYNKATTSRDFDNWLEGTVDIPWTDRVKTSLDLAFDYFYKAGADTSFDSSIFINPVPLMIFKVSDAVNLKVGYWAQFVELVNYRLPVVDGSLIDDPNSAYGSAATGWVTSDPNFSPLFGSMTAPSVPLEGQSVWWSNHAATVGGTLKVNDWLSLAADYRFVFLGMSNFESQRWRGHYIIPSASVTLPKIGTALGVKDEIRFQNYTDALTTAGGGLNKFRSRLTLTVDQPINDNLTISGWYRMDYAGSNEDNWGKFQDSHWIYLGATVAF
jgi:hypothetical protein